MRGQGHGRNPAAGVKTGSTRTRKAPRRVDFALDEGRIFVSRNRDDFLRLVIAAFQAGLPSPGVLVVPRSLPNTQPAAAIAHALLRWNHLHSNAGGPGLCIFDFLP